LIHELAPMNEHERTYATLGNHTGTNDGLTESGRSSKNASVVITQRFEGAFLVLTQRTNESHVNSGACLALVSEFDPNLQLFEKRADHIRATAWERDVSLSQFGTRDDSGRIMCR